MAMRVLTNAFSPTTNDRIHRKLIFNIRMRQRRQHCVVSFVDNIFCIGYLVIGVRPRVTVALHCGVIKLICVDFIWYDLQNKIRWASQRKTKNNPSNGMGLRSCSTRYFYFALEWNKNPKFIAWTIALMTGSSVESGYLNGSYRLNRYSRNVNTTVFAILKV